MNRPRTISIGAPRIALMVLGLAGTLALPLLTGCTTVNGVKQPDVAKLEQARAIITPLAASGIRRALTRSPEHAPQIARYASSFAGVFCSMALSNEFRVEFLLAESDKFADPELAKIGDGYLLDVKNSAVALYKVFYGDRFRAEISETNWLHQVCLFFCEAINQGLTDAGYPGGVRKTAQLKRNGRDLKDQRAEFVPARQQRVVIESLSPLGSAAPVIFTGAGTSGSHGENRDLAKAETHNTCEKNRGTGKERARNECAGRALSVTARGDARPPT